MFNFGAFAGGLAEGIQAGQKMTLDQQKLDAEIKSAQDKLKLEGDKLKKQQEDDIKKAEKDKADGAVKVEEVMGKTDIGLEARINQANNMSKIYGLGTAKAMMTDPTSGEKFVADVTQKLLPEIDKIQKDLDIYKNEGNYKLDNTGALYTRPNAESEFTPIGFKGTNAKVFTKEEKVTSTEMYNLTSPDGKVFKNTPLTAQETIDYRNKGYSFEKVYKPDRIINMGDKNPTAYSSVQVSSLPAVEQDILSKAGYSLTDYITMQDKSRIIGYENKPDAKTTYGDVMIESWKKAVEGGYDGSLAQFKAEEEAKGAASGAAVKADTTITKAEQAKNKILGGKNIVDLEPGSKEENQLDNYFKLKVIENKKDLFSAKDKEILSAAPVLHENLKRMTSGKADDVSGFADNIISNIKTFTGMGMNVEEEAKIKSTMEQMGYSMARSMSGTGVLSNTDVKNGSKAVGSLWESDEALAGKLQGLVENTVTNLKAIRKRETTDKDAFDLYYGKTLKSFESLAEGLKNPKDKILSKDDILGVKHNSNNTLPPLDINKFKK